MQDIGTASALVFPAQMTELRLHFQKSLQKLLKIRLWMLYYVQQVRAVRLFSIALATGDILRSGTFWTIQRWYFRLAYSAGLKTRRNLAINLGTSRTSTTTSFVSFARIQDDVDADDGW